MEGLRANLHWTSYAGYGDAGQLFLTDNFVTIPKFNSISLFSLVIHF